MSAETSPGAPALEQQRSAEVSTKVSRYRESHGLSQVMRNPDVKKAIATGSVADRKEYWRQKPGNWGQNMVDWMRGKDGKGGMLGWVAEQRQAADGIDGIVFKKVMTELGLLDSQDAPVNNNQVKAVVERINADLQAAGKETLNVNALSPDELASINFYARYLDVDPTKPEEQEARTQQLVADLVAGATSDEIGAPPTADEIFQRLELFSPLLRTKGEEAQHAVAAQVASFVHEKHEGNKVDAATPTNDGWQDHEKRVVEFAKKHGATIDLASGAEKQGAGTLEKVQPLESGKSLPLTEIMGKVTEPPARREDNPKWWIEGNLPDVNTALEELARDYHDMKDLTKTEGVFIPHHDPDMATQGYAWINFPPIKDINPNDDENSRLGRLEALTNRDSGLLAVSGVSRETPAQQAELYTLLGRVTLETYRKNPGLLRDFLEAQNTPIYPDKPADTSLGRIAVHEIVRAQEPLLRDRIRQVAPEISQDLDVAGMQQQIVATRGEAFLMQQVIEPIQTAALPRLQALQNEFGEDQDDRLIVLTFQPGGYSLNMEATLRGWEARLAEGGDLEAALSSGIFTPEQLRQIEFLSHGVKIEVVMQWLRNRNAEQADPANPSDPGNPDPTDPTQPTQPDQGGGQGDTPASAQTPTPAPAAPEPSTATPSATSGDSGATTAAEIVPPHGGAPAEDEDTTREAAAVSSATGALSGGDDAETLKQQRVGATSGGQPSGADPRAMADESTVHTAAQGGGEGDTRDIEGKTTARMQAAVPVPIEEQPVPAAPAEQVTDRQPAIPGAPAAPIIGRDGRPDAFPSNK